MIKKTLFGVMMASMLAGFVFGRDVFSYAKTFGSSVREAVKSEIDLEFEVDRAREMVGDLMPEIRECMSIVAEQQVDVRNVRTDVTERELALKTQRDAILALRSDLGSDNDTFVYASRSYTRDDVAQDLSQRFERYKAAEANVDADRQILNAREKALLANEDKLEGMLSRKQELEVQLAQLEARLKTVQAAETVTNLEIDNSRLSRAQKLITDLNKQLDVKEALLDAEGRFTGLIPVESRGADSKDVAAEVDAWFGASTDKAVDAEKRSPSA